MAKTGSFSDTIHIKIHALRMWPKYKPSQFEADLNRLVAEEYKDECSECKQKVDQLKVLASMPQQNQNKSFIGGLFGGS